MLLYNFELVSDNLGCKKSDLLLLKFADGVYFADGDFLLSIFDSSNLILSLTFDKTWKAMS